jgi:CRISPR type III-A-associated protein Csm2
LAYAVGRAEKKKKYGIKNFTDTFTPAIREASKSEENFNRFTKILEATVAYHKYHGGAE